MLTFEQIKIVAEKYRKAEELLARFRASLRRTSRVIFQGKEYGVVSGIGYTPFLSASEQFPAVDEVMIFEDPAIHSSFKKIKIKDIEQFIRGSDD